MVNWLDVYRLSSVVCKHLISGKFAAGCPLVNLTLVPSLGSTRYRSLLNSLLEISIHIYKHTLRGTLNK